LGAALSFSAQKSWYLSPLIVNPENTFKGKPHSLQFRPLSATLPTSTSTETWAGPQKLFKTDHLTLFSFAQTRRGRLAIRGT